jgi:diacylglycerol kinase family enzyme
VDDLTARARARGIAVRVLGEGEDSAEVARAANGDALGVAGGDGSLAAVAEVALERGLPFVCIPYGTRNHFARDLGLDRDDPLGALAAFSGLERTVDVGLADGRLFLNNVALGLYARLVHRREHHRRRRDAFATIRALLLLAGARGRQQHLSIDGQLVSASVALVTNNAYELDVFNVGERKRLDGGRLHLYVAHGWRPRTWEERAGTEFTIESDARLPAAIDGEPTRLDSKVRFTVEPRGLRVLVPPGS